MARGYRLVHRVRRAALPLRWYAPQPELRLPRPEVLRPRFPAIDAHNHLGGPFAGRWRNVPAADLLELMDSVGLEAIVDLDGGWGRRLERALDRLQRPHPQRFAVFAGIDEATFARAADFGEVEARRLRASVGAGARGLKVWKRLGLQLRDPRGDRIAIDDARLDPLWAAAGELDVPVLIHVGDPLAFFAVLDRHNERYEELAAHPDWHLGPGSGRPRGAPGLDDLLVEFARVLDRHPGTRFIGAHVGGLAEDLAAVARMLDAHPNLWVDIASRVNELGRQPYTARDFLLRYQDRVLFALDLPPNEATYRLAFTFLETRAEHFPYSPEEPPRQGRWRIYGVDLPDDALRRIYADNARRLIFGGRSTSG
jgi:predicted TIM-barrel fold metal-dependent hydrolase